MTKRFGPVLANDGISIALWAGEIHALLGENGAGKTTLLHVLAGMVRPDGGEVLVDGRRVAIASPAAARKLGIGVVYQHFALVPTLSITENALLGPGGLVPDIAAAEQRLTPLLRDLGLEVPPRTEVRHLSVGQRQRAEIAKALFRGARILLLDEPTSVLSPAEVDGLFALLRRLTAGGTAVALITHKLSEALTLSERLTVLRAGRVVARLTSADVAADRPAAEQRTIAAMFGADSPVAPIATPQPEPVASHLPTATPLLSLRHVSARDDRGAVAVHDASLDLRAGEIVGIGGIDGNGQRELAELIAGQRHATAGRVLIAGRDLTNRGVAATIRAGLAYLTDDRLGEGIVPGLSLAENLALKAVAAHRPPVVRGPRLSRPAVARLARESVTSHDIRPPVLHAPAARLSGGNLQKLILARELALDPAVLVAKEPTAGLDLRTAQAVARLLRDRVAAGGALLLFSTDLDEVLALSDRVGVMAGGRLVALLPRAAVDRTVVARLLAGDDGGHHAATEPR